MKTLIDSMEIDFQVSISKSESEIWILTFLKLWWSNLAFRKRKSSEFDLKDTDGITERPTVTTSYARATHIFSFESEYLCKNLP